MLEKEVTIFPVGWLVGAGLLVLGVATAITKYVRDRHVRDWWEKKAYGDPEEILSVGPTGPHK